MRGARTNLDYIARLNGLDASTPDGMRVAREEAIAHLAEMHLARSLQERPWVTRALDRMTDFVDRLGSALRGQGFQSAEGVFRAMTGGRGDRMMLGEPGQRVIDGPRDSVRDPVPDSLWHGTPHVFAPEVSVRLEDGSVVRSPGGDRMDPALAQAISEGRATVVREHPLGRFDMRRIGSGEGAAAYGVGPYLAENRGVAEGYRRDLAGATRQDLETMIGEALSVYGDRSLAARGRGQAAPDYLRFMQSMVNGGFRQAGYRFNPRQEEALRRMLADPEAQNRIYRLIDGVERRSMEGRDSDEFDSQDIRDFAALSDIAARYEESGGALYEVRADVDPERLVDWDAPAEAQPRAVQEAMGDLGVWRGRTEQPELVWGEPIASSSRRDPRIAASGEMIPLRSVDPTSGREATMGWVVRAQGRDGPRPDDWWHAYMGPSLDPNLFMGAGTSLEHAQQMVRSQVEANQAAQARAGSPDGRRLYLGVGERMNQAAGEPAMAREGQARASAALAERGVQGLRYFDGNSRRDGRGTRNYVTFTDDVLEILNRYSTREVRRDLPLLEGAPTLRVDPPAAVVAADDFRERRRLAAEWIDGLRERVNARGGILSVPLTEALGRPTRVMLTGRLPRKVQSHLTDTGMEALYSLPAIIARGRVLASEAPRAGREGQIERAFHIGANIDVSGGTIPMRVVVREDINGQFAYDLRLGAGGREDARAETVSREKRDPSRPAAPEGAAGRSRAPSPAEDGTLPTGGEDGKFSRREVVPPEVRVEEVLAAADPRWRPETDARNVLARQVWDGATEGGALLGYVMPEYGGYAPFRDGQPEDGPPLFGTLRDAQVAARAMDGRSARGQPRETIMFRGQPMQVLRQYSAREGQPLRGAESAADRAIAKMKQERWPASQLLGLLANTPGIKADELQWTGLADWLRGKGSDRVTKDEVRQFLRDNDLRVYEVQMGGRPEWLTEPDLTSEALAVAESLWRVREARDLGGWIIEPADRSTSSRRTRRLEDLIDRQFDPSNEENRFGSQADAVDALQGALFDELAEMGPHDLARLIGRDVVDRRNDQTRAGEEEFALARGGPPRYSSYVAGGSPQNYGELLFTLPPDAERGGRSRGDYTSSHWSAPNVLAHVRFSERQDATGRPVLFVEEVQSDWHQAGQGSGYRQAPDPARIAAAEVEEAARMQALFEAGRALQAQEAAVDALQRRLEAEDPVARLARERMVDLSNQRSLLADERSLLRRRIEIGDSRQAWSVEEALNSTTGGRVFLWQQENAWGSTGTILAAQVRPAWTVRDGQVVPGEGFIVERYNPFDTEGANGRQEPAEAVVVPSLETARDVAMQFGRATLDAVNAERQAHVSSPDRRRALQDRDSELVDLADRLRGRFAEADLALARRGDALRDGSPEWQAAYRRQGELRDETRRAEAAYQEASNALRTARDAGTSGVPDAPFKQTWPSLVMKRMFRYAIDHGMEAVMWGDGQVHARRWGGGTNGSISRPAQLVWNEATGRLMALDASGQAIAGPYGVQEGITSVAKLRAALGPDWAARIAEQPVSDATRPLPTMPAAVDMVVPVEWKNIITDALRDGSRARLNDARVWLTKRMKQSREGWPAELTWGARHVAAQSRGAASRHQPGTPGAA
jgi:hypothetical protein